MIESFEYEDCCRASSHTDFNGAVVNYDFDVMKRETKRIYPDGSWIERRYNTRGQVARVMYSGQYGFANDRVMTYDNVTGRLLRDDKEDVRELCLMPMHQNNSGNGFGA